MLGVLRGFQGVQHAVFGGQHVLEVIAVPAEDSVPVVLELRLRHAEWARPTTLTSITHADLHRMQCFQNNAEPDT